MTKFIIRNDDLAFDTTLSKIKKFCEICDKYGFPIMQAITPMGECKKIKTHRWSNERIKALSNKEFSNNVEVLKYLKSRSDLIAVHGLWHTHAPSMEEIMTAKKILEDLGLKPGYYVPPFNEGSYPETIAGMKLNVLSSEKGERLEDFLEKGTPTSPIVYLHSWRFDNSWYTFDRLEKCLSRIENLSQ